MPPAYLVPPLLREGSLKRSVTAVSFTLPVGPSVPSEQNKLPVARSQWPVATFVDPPGGVPAHAPTIRTQAPAAASTSLFKPIILIAFQKKAAALVMAAAPNCSLA